MAINAALEEREGIAVNSARNIYSPDGEANVVREATASTGFIATFAGMGTQWFSGDNGPTVNAELNSPMGVAVDSAGNVLIADDRNSRVRKLHVSTVVITTVAGTGPADLAGEIATLGLAGKHRQPYICTGLNCQGRLSNEARQDSKSREHEPRLRPPRKTSEYPQILINTGQNRHSSRETESKALEA